MDPKWCFKFQHELVDNLNVAFNISNGMLMFWNKFQIFLMDKQNLFSPGHQLNWRWWDYTDFEIHQLILAEHLLCLDKEGNLFTYSLNLEQTATAQKRPKHNFQKIEDNILCMEWYENLLFSIKSEMGELFLRTHKIKSTDNVFVTLKLYSNNKIANECLLQLPSEIKRDKCMLYCYRVDGTDFDSINQIFKKDKSLKCNQFIIIVSFDKLTLYSVLIDLELNGNILVPIKLLTCPSEINGILVMKEKYLNLLITLSAGTVIKQPLNDNFNTPNIAHLNTAIHRFTVLSDKIIYTDAITMWVSTNTFSESDSKLRQLFVKNVKDFTQIENSGKIICTTYSKLVYTFNVKDESSYLVPIASEYYSAEHLFNNMNYLHKIMDEVDKNDEIIKNIKKEENYITTLALANRQDIMNEIIQLYVSAYEKYEDILKEDLVLNLTNNLKDYFERDSFYFLIKISAAVQQNSDILANIFTDSKVHITFLAVQKIITTVSINVTDQLKNFNIVIPIGMNRLNITDVNVDIKIVKKVPKVVNCKQNLWTAVYCKQVTLTPEHFIKINFSDNNVRLLKDPEDSIDILLYKTVYKHHGHLLRITKVPEDLLTWSFYIKLPNKYKEILQNEISYKEHFNNSTKAKFLLKEASSEEFLNSRKSVSFLVFNEKLNMEIINDGFSNNLNINKMIKVTCANPLLALGIRNFYSNIIHNNFQECQHGQRFINYFKIFSSFEKTEKAVKKCIDESLPFEEFFKIYEQFQINLCETLV